MLPPERTATTGGSNALGSASSAATAAAPAGSTTSLARSRQSSRARDRASSETVTTSSTSSRTMGEGHVARAADRDAVGHRRHRRPAATGPAGGQRGRVRRGALGLHADHPDVGRQRLDRDRDAGEQPAAAGADDDGAHVRALLEDLQADRALPGDDVGVVERVDEHRAGLARRCSAAATQRLVDGLPVRAATSAP